MKNIFKVLKKDFVALLEMASKIGLEKIEAAINEIERLNPGSVDFDKIAVICLRRNIYTGLGTRPSGAIEEFSKQMLSIYAAILENDAQESEVSA